MMGIVYFALLLGIIVTIHEVGHFVAAKSFGIYCAEFSIGMGPKLFAIQGKETKYTIRLLPFGGYVAMAGDTENALEPTVDVETLPKERTLKGIAHWKRIIIMLAGILMNFVLAFVLFTGIIMNEGILVTSDVAQIGGISENSPAHLAGFELNDRIVKVEYEDGTIILPTTFTELSKGNVGHEQEARTYTLLRDTKEISITVTPVLDVERNSYLIGILAPTKIEKLGILESIKISTNQMFTIAGMIGKSLMELFTGKNLDQLSGPIGIYTVTQEQASLGLTNYVWLIAVLSLNVGIFNALPLPILDGGRAIMAVIEIIRGKPVSEKFEQITMSVGLAAMMLLMVFATWQDIVRLFVK